MSFSTLKNQAIAADKVTKNLLKAPNELGNTALQ